MSPPQWAYGAAGGAVVAPLAGKAEAGYAPGEKPPAPWVNYALNTTGQWLAYLAGPSLTAWGSHAYPAPDNAFAAPIRAAVDVYSEDSAEARYRYLVATTDDTGSCVLVSRRGTEWVLRRNFPGTPTAFLGAAYSNLYALVWSASEVYWCLRDDPGNPDSGAGASALRDAGEDWDTATLPASPGTLRDVTGNTNSGTVLASTSTKILRSNSNGATFSDPVSLPGARQSGRAVAIGVGTGHLTGVEISSDAGDGYIVRDLGLTGTWAHAQTLTGVGAATTWRLAVGPVADNGDVTFVAYKTGQTNPRLHVSTDDGVTWILVSAVDPPQNMTSLRYQDGVWLATQTTAPYAQASSDLERWLPVDVPVGEAGASLYDVVYGNNAWLLLSDDRALRGAPAVVPGAEDYSPDGPASPLADAGRIRGALVAPTEPSDGQVLVYDDTAPGSWVPTTLAATPTLPWSSAAAPVTHQTTDGTTATLATIPTTTNRGHTFLVTVSATLGDRSAMVSWVFLVTVTNVAGTVTVRDAAVLGPTDPAAAHVDPTTPVAFTVSGTDVLVRVTGVAATTVDWSAARTTLLGS